MIIIGAKGLAKQMLPLLRQNFGNEMRFFDDINLEVKSFAQHDVIADKNIVKDIFRSQDNRFVIGIGSPKLRKNLCQQFEQLDGKMVSLIDSSSSISEIETDIEEGVLILQQVIVESFVAIGKGTLLNIGVKICHDSQIGSFCEIGPNTVVAGNCQIGQGTSLGASVTIIPNISIGSNCIIGAGAVVTTDIPDNCTAVGVPAKIIKVR